eukprot:scaffold41083_cov191-Amphora_coffeaeformis.AAC.9
MAEYVCRRLSCVRNTHPTTTNKTAIVTMGKQGSIPHDMDKEGADAAVIGANEFAMCGEWGQIFVEECSSLSVQ